MTKSKLIALFIFIILLLVSCGAKDVINQGNYGEIVDKYETEDNYYILLDTDEWVQVEDGEYIGYDTGDFYEENFYEEN